MSAEIEVDCGPKTWTAQFVSQFQKVYSLMNTITLFALVSKRWRNTNHINAASAQITSLSQA